jgi:urease alpha subunit
LGISKDVGSIEVGKLADLVFYAPDNSPFVSLDNAMTTMWVMKGGRLWRSSDMAQLLPSHQPLSPGPVLNTPSVGA